MKKIILTAIDSEAEESAKIKAKDREDVISQCPLVRGYLSCIGELIDLYVGRVMVKGPKSKAALDKRIGYITTHASNRREIIGRTICLTPVSWDVSVMEAAIEELKICRSELDIGMLRIPMNNDAAQKIPFYAKAWEMSKQYRPVYEIIDNAIDDFNCWCDIIKKKEG